MRKLREACGGPSITAGEPTFSRRIANQSFIAEDHKSSRTKKPKEPDDAASHERRAS